MRHFVFILAVIILALAVEHQSASQAPLPVIEYAQKPEPEPKKVEASPHADALRLVFSKRAEDIRKVDQEKWWHDVKERNWKVSRPFDPGYLDSTHWFNVTYEIDGKNVGSWFVDSEKGKVSGTGDPPVFPPELVSPPAKEK